MATIGTHGVMGGRILPFLAAMLLLNAHALQREAEDRLALDSPVRAPALRVLKPLCRLTHALGIDRPRNWTEDIEQKLINE